MSKFLTNLLIALIVLGALAAALLAVQTALAQAQASLAQANANTMQSGASLVSQCLTGFLVLVALVAGGAVGYGIGKLRQRLIGLAKKRASHWQPGPNARWQRRHAPPASLPPTASPQLPATYSLPPAYLLPPPSQAQPQTYVLAEPEQDENGDEWLGAWWQ